MSLPDVGMSAMSSRVTEPRHRMISVSCISHIGNVRHSHPVHNIRSSKHERRNHTADNGMPAHGRHGLKAAAWRLASMTNTASERSLHADRKRQARAPRLHFGHECYLELVLMSVLACVVLSLPANSGEPLASSPSKQPKAQMSTFVVYKLRSRMSSGAR